MFGADAPPLEWDTARAYARGAVALYFLSNGAAPLGRDALVEVLHGGWPEGHREEGPQRYGPNAAGWVRVEERWTLGELLSRPEHVTPGVPVFFVVVGGSDFAGRLLRDELPML